jgi:hypothetical protein
MMVLLLRARSRRARSAATDQGDVEDSDTTMVPDTTKRHPLTLVKVSCTVAG